MATPAQRARQRKLPAIMLPPEPPKGDSRSALRRLKLDIAGRDWLIGPSIEGDPEVAATIDGAETITIDVRDQHANLIDALKDEGDLLRRGTTCTINGIVYALQTVESDNTGLVTLTLADQVQWRLEQFSRFISVTRTKRVTFARFADRLVQEASAPPLAPLNFFCPEINDRQRILEPKNANRVSRDVTLEANQADSTDGAATTSKGTGAATHYTVKHETATGPQRHNINAILTVCHHYGASRRVMIAAIMTATQESTMSTSATNGVHIGLYQQAPSWGTASQRRSAVEATRLFLNGWKSAHGSVKSAPGSLAADIEAVQRSGQGSLYATWESEATATVDTWLGSDDAHSLSLTKEVTTTTTVVEPYEFTRGEKGGQSENSWECLQRYAQERNWKRWAQYNTLFLVSEDELRAAKPAVEINGDEPWLLTLPSWSWSPKRPINEVTLNVLADRWGVQIGAVAVLALNSPVDGRWLVAEERGGLQSPEKEIVLRRPAPKKAEPPSTTHEKTSTKTTTTGGGSSGGVGPGAGTSDIIYACRTIGRQNRAYVYGGGHGKPLSQITAHEGLDCSSSVSLALKMAKMFPFSVALVSGNFASWGAAGKGKEFTVWYSATHVWIEFYGAGISRFDTSPHGCGPSGPHVRKCSRDDQSRFSPRHWPGR